MKYTKMLGLAIVAAMALMAFANSAFAAGGGLYNGSTRLGVGATLDFSIPSGTSAVLKDTSGNEIDKCATSTVSGTLENAGSSTVNPTGRIDSLTWESCSFPTKTLVPGKLQIEWTSGTTGTVKSDAQIEVTINTVLFGSCIYGVASGAGLGTLTTNSTTTATFDANAVATRFGSNFACPSTSVWTGAYTSTTPDQLRVEAS
jgi:hypothetical protein